MESKLKFEISVNFGPIFRKEITKIGTKIGKSINQFQVKLMKYWRKIGQFQFEQPKIEPILPKFQHLNGLIDLKRSHQKMEKQIGQQKCDQNWKLNRSTSE